MYIPAVPTTPMNLEYVKKQRGAFIAGERPPDFPRGLGEKGFVGTATSEDIISPEGRIAMGFE